MKFYCYLLLLSFKGFSEPGAAQPEAWGGAASASIREEISATPGNLGEYNDLIVDEDEETKETPQ